MSLSSCCHGPKPEINKSVRLRNERVDRYLYMYRITVVIDIIMVIVYNSSTSPQGVQTVYSMTLQQSIDLREWHEIHHVEHSSFVYVFVFVFYLDFLNEMIILCKNLITSTWRTINRIKNVDLNCHFCQINYSLEFFKSCKIPYDRLHFAATCLPTA